MALCGVFSLPTMGSPLDQGLAPGEVASQHVTRLFDQAYSRLDRGLRRIGSDEVAEYEGEAM